MGRLERIRAEQQVKAELEQQRRKEAAELARKQLQQGAAATTLAGVPDVMPWADRWRAAWGLLRLTLEVLAGKEAVAVVDPQEAQAGHAPGQDLAAKAVVRYGVDVQRRVVLLFCKGPLDVAETVAELRYAQLKHVAGQLITQEGIQEELVAKAKGGGGLTM